MNRVEKIKFLKENPVFWSRLGFCYDPPLKNSEGKPLVFTENLDKFARFHGDFEKAGVKIQTCILHLGWMGIDEYDYSLTDRVVEAVFKNSPDSYYIPRIKLNVPVDWCRENPEEILVYYEGPRDKEEIRALVDTPKHDWLGYTAPKGYYKAGDYEDTRPNVGGVISRQSFSSEKWLHDAGVALEKLINRLESGKWAERILGYQVSFGVSGEAILWGRADNHYGDYGITNTKKFYEWGLEKYASLENLKKAWGDERFENGSLILPSPDERYHRKDSVSEFFRADTLGCISSDMDEFTSKCCADAIEYFGKIVRRLAPEKLVGAFYGYFVHTDNPNYAGHLALERLLESEYVDFFAAPKSYYRCGPGESGGEMCATQSVNLKKLWVDESDNRTHLASDDVKEWVCEDFTQSRCVMWREFCKNFSHDSGFWWMDLGGGWYDAPEMLDEVARMVKVNDSLRSKPHESVADALVVVDEECIGEMNISADLRCGFMEDYLSELHRSGIVADIYRLRDIESLDLKKYKMIVFAYTFSVSENKRRYISENVSKDTLLVFHHAAGINKDGKISLDNVLDFTGFEMAEAKTENGYDFAEVKVVDKDSNVLFENSDGTAKTSIKENRVAVTSPFMTAKEIRELAKKAGCHIYTDTGIALWSDNRITGTFVKNRLSGNIVFPEKATYTEQLSGKVFEDVFAISLDELNTNAAVFIKK